MGYLTLALCGLTLAIGVSPAFAADAVPAGADASNVTPFVNTDGEIRVLPRTRPDRLYQLHIGLPASYGKEPNRKYPVIYVTDGYRNAEAVVLPDGTGYLVKSNLPALAKERTYQLWFVRPGAPTVTGGRSGASSGAWSERRSVNLSSTSPRVFVLTFSVSPLRRIG